MGLSVSESLKAGFWAFSFVSTAVGNHQLAFELLTGESRGDFYGVVETGEHSAADPVPVVEVPPLSCVPVPSAVVASAIHFSFLSRFDFSFGDFLPSSLILSFLFFLSLFRFTFLSVDCGGEMTLFLFKEFDVPILGLNISSTVSIISTYLF